MTKHTFHIGTILLGTTLICACTPAAAPSPVPPSSSSSTSSNPQPCTTEAMQCPDGSYVGRTGPDCAFAACPSSTTSTGKLEGTMIIGPICPVERPDHPCLPTPEMFAAHQVFISVPGSAERVATLIPDAEGKFSAALPTGTYIVDVQHQTIGSVRGVPATIIIESGKTVTLAIDIDTGIR